MHTSFWSGVWKSWLWGQLNYFCLNVFASAATCQLSLFVLSQQGVPVFEPEIFSLGSVTVLLMVIYVSPACASICLLIIIILLLFQYVHVKGIREYKWVCWCMSLHLEWKCDKAVYAGIPSNSWPRERVCKCTKKAEFFPAIKYYFMLHILLFELTLYSRQNN